MAISATIIQKSNKKLVPTSYGELVGLPTINGHEVIGDLDSAGLGLANALSLVPLLEGPVSSAGRYPCDLTGCQMIFAVVSDGLGGTQSMFLPVFALSGDVVLANDINHAIVCRFANAEIVVTKIEGAGANTPVITQVYGVNV